LVVGMISWWRLVSELLAEWHASVADCDGDGDGGAVVDLAARGVTVPAAAGAVG
jgi:hypothetical protein